MAHASISQTSYSIVFVSRSHLLGGPLPLRIIRIARRNFQTPVASHRRPTSDSPSSLFQMSHLTLTKSRTSRISRLQTKSPIKKPSFDLKTRSLNPPTTAPSSDRSSAATPKLEVTQLHLAAGTIQSTGRQVHPVVLEDDVDGRSGTAY
jgi:hypothetical protein